MQRKKEIKTCLNLWNLWILWNLVENKVKLKGLKYRPGEINPDRVAALLKILNCIFTTYKPDIIDRTYIFVECFSAVSDYCWGRAGVTNGRVGAGRGGAMWGDDRAGVVCAVLQQCGTAVQCSGNPAAGDKLLQ